MKLITTLLILTTVSCRAQDTLRHEAHTKAARYPFGMDSVTTVLRITPNMGMTLPLGNHSLDFPRYDTLSVTQYRLCCGIEKTKDTVGVYILKMPQPTSDLHGYFDTGIESESRLAADPIWISGYAIWQRDKVTYYYSDRVTPIKEQILMTFKIKEK